MIIFGWGHQKVKRFGPTFKRSCARCKNEEFWDLYRIANWFTLFFIPVVPYEYKYILICPICQSGMELERSDFEKLLPIAEGNTKFLQGHTLQIDNGNQTQGVASANTKDDIPLFVFCPYCGEQLELEDSERNERKFICPFCHKPTAL